MNIKELEMAYRVREDRENEDGPRTLGTLLSPLDEARFEAVVFRTDPRVVEHVRIKGEITLDEHGNPADVHAWRKGLDAAWALGKKGHAPEAGWVREAEILAERVGKRWDTAPIPTLVEALACRDGLWPLGFPTTVIRAGTRDCIRTQPQLSFRGRLLVLGSEALVEDLVVEDLKVGNQTIFVSCGPVPGCAFSATAFPFWLKLPTADICQNVAIMLHNAGPSDLRVTPVLYGDAIVPERLERFR